MSFTSFVPFSYAPPHIRSHHLPLERIASLRHLPTAWFLRMNHRNMLTVSLLVLIFLSIGSYVAALYAIFDIGLDMERLRREYEVVRDAGEERKIALGEDDARFVEGHSDVVAAMERIGSIIYLSAKNVAYFRTSGGDNGF